jgi:hypothetical protein
MQNTHHTNEASITIAELVRAAATATHVVPASLCQGLAPGSRILPAQVVTRFAAGCHIRVADEHDTILAPDALPAGADTFAVRIQRDGLVILPAV